MTVEIRGYRAADHAGLLVVWRGAVEGSHHFLTPPDVNWYEEVVAEHLPRLRDVRVAVVDGDPVGIIAQDDGEIHMLFVAPSAQGLGVGTALLENVADDHPELRLDVNEQNPAPWPSTPAGVSSRSGDSTATGRIAPSRYSVWPAAGPDRPSVSPAGSV